VISSARASSTIPRRLPFEVIERQMHYRNRHVCDLALHGVIRLDKQLDEKIAARAIRLCADVFPIFGCVVEEGPWGLTWVRRDDLDRREWCDVVTCDGDDAAALAEYVRVPCDPWKGTPPLHARLLRTPKGDTVVIKMHHAAADGISAKETFYTFAEMYRALLEDPEFRPTPRPYVRRVNLRALKPRQLLSVARHALQEQATTEQTGFIGVPLVDGGPEDTQFIDHRIAKAPFKKLRRYARDRHAAFHDLMNALFAYATLARFNGGKAGRVRIRNPVDLRRYDPAAIAAEGPRNLAGFASFDVNAPTFDLDAILVECREHFHSQFEGSRCPGLTTYPKMWLRNLLPNRQLTESSDRRWQKALEMKANGKAIQLPLIISNTGLIERRRLAIPGANVVDAVPIGFAYFHTTFFSFSIFEGELSIVARFCDRDGMGDHIRAMIATIDEQVARI
jgi:NRPS condensation-like uncharacterized protein